MPSQQRTARMEVRLTPSEAAAIKRRASSAGVSVSEYIRLRATVDRDGPNIFVRTDDLRRLLCAVKRAGGLMNQAQRSVNLHGLEGMEDQLVEYAKAVASASEDISAFLEEARNSI